MAADESPERVLMMTIHMVWAIWGVNDNAKTVCEKTVPVDQVTDLADNVTCENCIAELEAVEAVILGGISKDPQRRLREDLLDLEEASHDY
jgi:hypothetical protein